MKKKQTKRVAARIESLELRRLLAAAPNMLEMLVDANTGLTRIVGNASDPAEVRVLEVQSVSSSLRPDNWNSLADQGKAGWSQVIVKSSDLVEAKFGGGAFVLGAEGVSIGNVFNPGGSRDLKFLWIQETPTGQKEVAGPVTYVNGSTPTTGSISGSVFNDLNKNNVENAGESMSSNVTVFVDKDKDGVLDAGEPTSSVTSGYSFSNLTPGSYRVRALAPTGFKVSSPSIGYYDVTVTAGQDAGGKKFALQQTTTGGTTGSISGVVFSDADKDGVLDAAESKLASRKIYIDANSNGKFDSGEKSVFSNVGGVYTFTGLTAGTYRIGRADLPGGYYISTGSNGIATVSLAAGQNASGINVGAALGTPTGGTNGSISGTVFNDGDKDGVFDATESKLASRRIYIDSNSNGKFDSGEKSVFSNSSGVYTFTGLAAGTYRIGRADLPSGYYITTGSGGFQVVALGSGQNISGKNIGAALGTPSGGTTGSISGTVFNDADKDGILDSNESKLASRKIYIDANNNGRLDAGEKSAFSNSSGVYTFSGLAAGTYRLRRGDLPGGYYNTTPAGGVWTVTLGGGQKVTGRNFGAALR